MNLIDDIIRGEIEFPQDFTNMEVRPWGLMYHNVEIGDSWDSNHARILNADGRGLGDIIAEMAAFYRGRGLTPRVYHLSRPGGGGVLRAALEQAGFAFTGQGDRFFVHRRASAIEPRGEVEIRRVRAVTAELAQMIERSDGLRARKVVQRRIGFANMHFHVAFCDGRPVAMASLNDMGYVTQVGDVLTERACRGRGYCNAVIHRLVQYHAGKLAGPLELYTDNPVAERIYRRAGFEQLDEPLECWSAWLA